VVHKFGTIGGVFTPNVLTILGVIMYLRLGLGGRECWTGRGNRNYLAG
jgi:hypothetical protein